MMHDSFTYYSNSIMFFDPCQEGIEIEDYIDYQIVKINGYEIGYVDESCPLYSMRTL